MKILSCVVVAMAFAASPVHAASGHVHGVATLDVAVEGDRLMLDFVSPLENLIGFERAPRSDKEKEAARRLKEQFQKPELLFVASAEAGCVRDSVAVDAPVLDGGKADKDGHAALTASISFKCQRVQALSGIEVKAFDAFPRLTRIDVQVAAARKQSAGRATPKNRRIAW